MEEQDNNKDNEKDNNKENQNKVYFEMKQNSSELIVNR